MLVLFALLVILVSGKPAEHQDVSLIAEPVIDLTSGDAPAYWSAECGGRTYVGSYTLMMDWTQCRDYCTYFPHSAELGHTFSFADILDADTMECLRFNMNNQYTPGNGYAGHYWAGGYRGGDGQYRWDSGEPFEFDDFVGNPGEEPYLHLTPGNNYQWNTKNDQDDRNNGCLCKSQESASEVSVKISSCPIGWVNYGEKCARWTPDNRRSWYSAHDYCLFYKAELMSWRSEPEFKMIQFFWRELAVNQGDLRTLYSWTGAYRQDELWGDWTWGNVTGDWVPMSYGWGYTPAVESQCAFMNNNGVGLAQDIFRKCPEEKTFVCEYANQN